ncbi:MAG: DUF2938 domain-containing protein [Gemmatimonadaceae bacterium]|nr:DUF2938 domain-containing protein [Gemmatimonadaceae bacterium]
MLSLSVIVHAAAVGVGATLAMDLWNALLRRVFGIASLNFCLLGRWVRHLESGVVRHARIAASPARRHECAVGWAAHYTIGVSLALGLVVATAGDWLRTPTLAPAIVYGLLTLVFPLFVLQPALGLGVASSATPHPWRARLKSVASHLAFGAGLYASALALSRTPLHG